MEGMVKNSTDIYIHVGPHKSATTFLQNIIFPQIEEINYINKPKFDIKNPKLDFLKFDIEFDKKNLISNESFSGRQQFGGEGSKFEKTLQITDELYKTFPKAKIIVGYREKENWLSSLYSQYLKGGGILDYNDWYKKIFDKKFLEFDNYINYLKRLFDSVYIYKFSLLKKNPKEFTKGICNFMNVETPEFENKIINSKLNEKQLKLVKFLNCLWMPRKEGILNSTDIRNYRGFLPRERYFNPILVTKLLTEKNKKYKFFKLITENLKDPDNKNRRWKRFQLEYK